MTNKLPTPRLSSLIPTPFDPGLLVAATLTIFAVVPLLTHPGLPNTADGPVHLMRQVELNQAWKDGVLYPRWAPDLAYGYGMPLFNYAPPLLYHLTQLIHLTGLPLDASMKGTIILMMILYSVGMYLFARNLFGPGAGLLAAAVYLYTPYRLREATVQGNYGQFCGLAFYPLILWAFHGLVTTGRRRYLPLAALSLASLLLSHNISAMLFAPLLGAYLLFLRMGTQRLRKSGNQGSEKLGNWETGKLGDQEMRPPDSPALSLPIPNFLPPIIAITLGLGLSAFFWLPAFGERNLIRLSGITSGFFDFRHNFISLTELLALPRPLDMSAINPYFPLSLGLAQVTFAVLAIAYCVLRVAYCVLHDTQYAVRSTHHAPHMSSVPFFAVALLIYAFLALPQSQPIWEMVPLLELTEFPWRMLGPAVLCASVLAGAALHWLERLGIERWELGIGLFFTLAVNLYYLFPAQFIPWGTPTPADAVAYEAQSRAIGTTSTGEFLPRWADRYPSPDTLGSDYAAGKLPTKLDPASLPPGATAVTLTHTARETRVAVHSPAPFDATFRALYWPGWQVIVANGAEGDGGQPVEVQITQPDGLIRARLPAGEYQVVLRLSATPIRRAGMAISGLSLAALLGLVVVGRVNESTNQRISKSASQRVGESPISNLPTSEALLITAALVAGLLVTRPLVGWFRVQSPPDAVYGAQFPTQADFADQVRLLAFDLPARAQRIPHPPAADTEGLPRIQARAGDSLSVVLYWRALVPLATDYSVFVHLDAPDEGTYATADERHPENIPTSHWPPSLYLRDPLTLDLPADAPPIRYTLTAGLYDPETGARLPVTGCDGCPSIEGPGDALPLAYVWLVSSTPLDEGDIPHRLDYRLRSTRRVGETIALLGYDLRGDGLTLYWRTSASLATGYTVFIHALDANGEIVAQFDAPPLNGLYPTDAWLPGQVIADAHTIALPESVQTLAIGLYDLNSLARLSVTDGDGRPIPDNAIRLQLAGSRGQGADGG